MFGGNVRVLIASCAAVALSVSAAAPQPFEVSQGQLQDLLPPSPPWQGESTRFALPKDHEWVTPTEAGDFAETATYAQVSAYAARLAEASDAVTLRSLTTLPSGEDIWLLTVTRESDPSPEGLKAGGKPIVFIQSGIHPGESMGVNAGLMLVRDLAGCTPTCSTRST